MSLLTCGTTSDKADFFGSPKKRSLFEYQSDYYLHPITIPSTSLIFYRAGNQQARSRNSWDHLPTRNAMSLTQF
jgi:hypothetical protein